MIVVSVKLTGTTAFAFLLRQADLGIQENTQFYFQINQPTSRINYLNV
jgi:hypothetical protein